MTCQECLSTLATASVIEIDQSDGARQHCATCEDCSRVIRLITESEHDLAVALDRISSSVPATQTAETAIALARRRRTGKVLSIVFAVLIAITLWITWIQVIVPSMRATAEIAAGNHLTETIKLRCLSSDQAGELISPYVRSSGSVYYPAKPPMRVITVRGTPEELRTVKALLHKFDDPDETTCASRP